MPDQQARLVRMDQVVVDYVNRRIAEGRVLRFEFNDPDETGVSDLVIAEDSGNAPDVDEDEVLFPTSRERIFQAYLAWYEHAYPRAAGNRTQSLDSSRSLMRYLAIPTVQELQQYNSRYTEATDNGNPRRIPRNNSTPAQAGAGHRAHWSDSFCV